MILEPKRISKTKGVETSPLKFSNQQNFPLYAFIARSKKPKLNIKIGKYKLPKDFFSSKSTSNTLYNHKRTNTDRQALILINQNQTPKFNEAKNKTSLFKSTRTLGQNETKILISNTSPNNIESFDYEKPLRNLSTQLKFVKHLSCKRRKNDIQKQQKIGTHRSKLQVMYRSDWERPKKLPPINLNETMGKTLKNIV